MRHYDFIDDDGNILLWKLASGRKSPDDPRYIPPELVEALARLKFAKMREEAVRNVAALEAADARKAAQQGR